MIAEITRSFGFEAAHRLPRVPVGHRCALVHGHSYKVTVAVRARMNPQLGWVVDFGAISEDCESLIRRRLDHRYLNEIDGLQNPTAENLAVWILRALGGVPYPVVWVEVRETERSSAKVWAEGGEGGA